ncbi:unnamed protein product [Phytophthora lilii]|uniref:Unnamed protein product n=1 Tax=Phytophthora lilii TaxID=2077276 RepID=A0A9W6X5L7_9STRA|nr:unnamed protein product [Phytophthora lilii]
MAEEETPYSDEEFGSEHEYEGGYEEFADEVIDKIQDTVKQDPVEANEEDAEQYDGKFDEDGPPTVVVAGNPIVEAPTDAAMAAKVQEDAETYDGEFYDDDSIVVDAGSPALVIHDAAVEKIPTATDVLTVVPQDNIEVVDCSPSTSERIEQYQDGDSEAEYSNELEQDVAEVPAVNTQVGRDSSEEKVTQRRSSIPSSVIARLSEESPPKPRIVRAGSMPIVLSAASLDKWMDTIPPELSPERHDRSRKQSACFPVQEEMQTQNMLDDENTTEDVQSYLPPAGVDSTPRIASSRVRAQSYQDLQSEKTVVPIRRAQSLLYAGSLPSVEEAHAVEEVTANNQEGDGSYSGEEDSYGEDSQSSFESEHEHDEGQPATIERPKSGPCSFVYEASMATHESTANGDHTGPGHEVTTHTDDLNSYAITVEQFTLQEGDTLVQEPPQNNDDEYADEMEDDFPSEANTPPLEGENSSYKSNDKVSDYDVDEFIEDGRRETETHLQEARTLLELQQTVSKPVADVQTVVHSDSPLQAETGEESPCHETTRNGSTKGENQTTPYDDDDEFAEANADSHTPELDAADGHSGTGIDKYENDFEEQAEVHQDNSIEPTPIVKPEISKDCDVTQETDTSEQIHPTNSTSCSDNGALKTKDDTSEVTGQETLTQDHVTGEQVQSPKTNSPPATVEVKEEKTTTTPSKAVQSPSAVTGQAATRHKQPVKKADPPAKQSSPTMKPSRPFTNKPVPPPPSAKDQPTATPRSSRSKLKALSNDRQAVQVEPAASNSLEATASSLSSRKQVSPPKVRLKVSSPRSPSKTSSTDPYQYLPNEYPQLPRKELVPKQKTSSKPSTSGEHGGKRRLLQPVRTPANLRFDLPKMDKTKRDWLFVNMFRHGDDLSKYEAFMPQTMLARPPTSSNIKETKKRPLSARQVYGDPQMPRYVSSGRRLVQPPNPELQSRERNWVATTPHDSKLPPYDSILDKYCTTVTSPVVQRQIYQTRHRDLSPQLAFVLEKRVEKHCRKGFYDSFGGVSSSYKTEIVPTSPGDGSRQRQLSPRSQLKSGLTLERQASSPMQGHEQ